MAKLSKKNAANLNTIEAFEVSTILATCGCSGDCRCGCPKASQKSSTSSTTYTADAKAYVSKVTKG